MMVDNMDNGSKGRARPPGGPLSAESAARVNLNHATPSWVKTGSAFFVTLCCEQRGHNQLCLEKVSAILIDAARFYQTKGDWFIGVFLLMPDHLHALLAPAPDRALATMMGDWKRYTRQHAGIVWQKNFIDHRLCSDESWDEKANYIRMNPVRAGLIKEGETWPFMIER